MMQTFVSECSLRQANELETCKQTQIHVNNCGNTKTLTHVHYDITKQ